MAVKLSWRLCVFGMEILRIIFVPMESQERMGSLCQMFKVCPWDVRSENYEKEDLVSMLEQRYVASQPNPFPGLFFAWVLYGSTEEEYHVESRSPSWLGPSSSSWRIFGAESLLLLREAVGVGVPRGCLSFLPLYPLHILPPSSSGFGSAPSSIFSPCTILYLFPLLPFLKSSRIFRLGQTWRRWILAALLLYLRGLPVRLSKGKRKRKRGPSQTKPPVSKLLTIQETIRNDETLAT